MFSRDVAPLVSEATPTFHARLVLHVSQSERVIFIHAHVWYRKSLCKIICPDKKIKEREKERERKKGKKENSEVWVIKLKVITEEVFIHPRLEQKHPVVEFLHTFSLHNIRWNICVLRKISVDGMLHNVSMDFARL